MSIPPGAVPPGAAEAQDTMRGIPVQSRPSVPSSRVRYRRPRGEVGQSSRSSDYPKIKITYFDRMNGMGSSTPRKVCLKLSLHAF